MIENMLFKFDGQEWSSSIRSMHFNLEVKRESIEFNEKSISFIISNQQTHDEHLSIIYRLQSGGIRFVTQCQKPHYSPSLEDTVIYQKELYSLEEIQIMNILDDSISIGYDNNVCLVVNLKPFSIQIKQNSIDILQINSKSMLSIDHNSIDVSFSNASKPVKLIGLPARESEIFLTPTIKIDDSQTQSILTDPFRIFNCDTGPFRPPKTFSVYGAINFLQSENSAIFYSNSSDTYFDLISENCEQKVTSHFLSECGPIDLFLFVGTRNETTRQFITMTGTTFFPSMSNFGFGHSKWGIKDENDAQSIIRLYDENNILFDALWLDIDHLESNQPFTVNKKLFPHYVELINDLESGGLKRNLAIIEDPHLPYQKNHEIAEDCLSKNLEVKTHDMKTFVGKCWPGDSIYPDFYNEEARKWWGSKVPLNVNQWNDMNEPSVFESLETTMPRNNIHKCIIPKPFNVHSPIVHLDEMHQFTLNSHNSNQKKTLNGVDYGFVEHRNVHNLYGHFHSMSTYNGVKERTKQMNSPKPNMKRPFVLTRSYFAGSSRHAAVWTGDGPTSLKDLRISLHQITTAMICGMPYLGADIGGFFGDPSKEFLEVWFVNAVWFYPFLRLHSEINTKPRQQIVATSNVIRSCLNERYLFVPYWYTMFYELHILKTINGVRFAYVDYPEIFGDNSDEITLVGDSILTAPAYNFDANSESFVTKSPRINEFMNNYVNLRKLMNKIGIADYNEETNTKLLPLFAKKGKIIPLFTNPTKSINLTRRNKMSLIIVTDQNNQSEGNLFLDDGETFNFEVGDCTYRQFVYNDGKLQNKDLRHNSEKSLDLNDNFKDAEIGRIVVIKNENEIYVQENCNIKVVDNSEITLTLTQL